MIFFFFNILDSSRCKYNDEGGVLKISKGTHIVMKGKKMSTKIYICAVGFFCCRVLPLLVMQPLLPLLCQIVILFWVKLVLMITLLI